MMSGKLSERCLLPSTKLLIYQEVHCDVQSTGIGRDFPTTVLYIQA